MRSSRKKWPGAWIGIVLASSFLLVGAMKMSAYAEPAESTETAEITESSTGAGLSDMDFGMGDGQIELDPYDQVSDFGFSDSEGGAVSGSSETFEGRYQKAASQPGGV